MNVSNIYNVTCSTEKWSPFTGVAFMLTVFFSVQVIEKKKEIDQKSEPKNVSKSPRKTMNHTRERAHT